MPRALKDEALAPGSDDLPFVDYALPTKTWNHLILVGEAPGKDEVTAGKPFVGRSGQLLNEMLESAQIEREACIVANVFRYRPPNNKVGHFFSSRKAAKNEGIELAEAYGKFGSALCRSKYAVEIDHLGKFIKNTAEPRLVIAVGSTAFWALTGEGEISKNAGKVFPCRLLPGTDVIATYHPSYIMRGNWGLKDHWRTHFDLAKKRLTP